jgi:hypothetical protein
MDRPLIGFSFLMPADLGFSEHWAVRVAGRYVCLAAPLGTTSLWVQIDTRDVREWALLGRSRHGSLMSAIAGKADNICSI